MLTKAEKELLLGFLQELSDNYGHAGCNEYSLPNTPENREVMRKALTMTYSEDQEELEDEFDYLENCDKTIHTIDTIVLDYIVTKVESLETE